MKNKQIILWLIIQDLKHLRLECPQCHLERTNPEDGLTIFQIIIKLFELEDQLDETDFDKLGEFYYDFLESMEGQESPKSEEGFMSRAEHCYELIAACVHMRNLSPKLETYPQ